MFHSVLYTCLHHFSSFPHHTSTPTTSLSSTSHTDRAAFQRRHHRYNPAQPHHHQHSAVLTWMLRPLLRQIRRSEDLIQIEYIEPQKHELALQAHSNRFMILKFNEYNSEATWRSQTPLLCSPFFIFAHIFSTDVLKTNLKTNEDVEDGISKGSQTGSSHTHLPPHQLPLPPSTKDTHHIPPKLLNSSNQPIRLPQLRQIVTAPT